MDVLIVIDKKQGGIKFQAEYFQHCAFMGRCYKCLQQMNKSNILFTIILILLCACNTQCLITPTQMDTLLTAIDALFFLPNAARPIDIRKFVRGAFHDCMGGCDGSFNLTNSANRGLQTYATLMNNQYSAQTDPRRNLNTSTQFNLLTRADFFMLCEQRALAWGFKNDLDNAGFKPTINTPNNFTFYYGRPNTDPFDADPFEGTIPDGSDSWQTMLDGISVGLNKTVNENDVVALFGTHGSGVANFNNSGFVGPWGPRADLNIINNHFYVNLLSYNFPGNGFTQVSALSQFNPAAIPSPLDGGYVSTPPPTTKIQWNHIRTGPPNTPQSGARMMLPIDMQIYLNFAPNGTDGGSTIDGYCPQANNQTGNPNFIFDCSTLSTPARPYLGYRQNTAALAVKYAQNNTLFLTDLISAYLKMSSQAASPTMLFTYKADYVCRNNIWTCLGTIFFESCGTAPSGSC